MGMTTLNIPIPGFHRKMLLLPPTLKPLLPPTLKPLLPPTLKPLPSGLCIRSRLRRKTRTSAGGGRGSHHKNKDDTTAASSQQRLKRRPLKPEEHPKWCSNAPTWVDRMELLSITFAPLEKLNKILSSFGIYATILGAVLGALKCIRDWANKDNGLYLKKLQSFVARFGVHLLVGACIIWIAVRAIIFLRNYKNKVPGDQNAKTGGS